MRVLILLSVILSCIALASAQTNPRRSSTPAMPGQLILQLHDSVGLPVSGALAAMRVEWLDEKNTGRPDSAGDMKTFMRMGATRPMISSAAGELAIPAAQVFGSRQLDSVSTTLFIVNQSKRLGAFIDVTPADVSAPVAVALQPLCFVHAMVESPDMEGAGHPMSRTGASVARIASPGSLVKSVSENGRVGMLLPAGNYQLTVGGVATDGATYAPSMQTLEIAPGQTDLDLDTISLASSAMTDLLGKPAPELRGIVEWRNGSPVTLEKLRGKVVILDFWAYSCSICIGEMPTLFQLQKQYANNPDLVIIAMHAPNASTLDEAYEKCAVLRAKAWHGADIPFRVALDSPDGTFEAFGVRGVPNTLVIDRDGNLARRFYAISNLDFRQEIEQLLNAKASPIAGRSSIPDRNSPALETSPPPIAESTSFTVKATGIHIQRHLTDEQLALIPGGRNGMVVQLLISAPGKRIVGIDESHSTISKFSDDNGSELRKYDEGDFWEGAFTHEARTSQDGHSSAVEIASAAEPSLDATKIILKGSLVIKIAGTERSLESKDVLLQPDSKFEVGPYEMKLAEIKTKDLRENMKVGLTLNFDGDPDAIRSIKFFDPLKREIGIAAIRSTSSDNHNTREYQLSERPKTITVHLDGYEKLDKVKVPVDLQIGLGL
jgi:thiol-disulfide isomerase/thioredoxin